MRRVIIMAVVALGVVTVACVAGRQHDYRLWTNAEQLRPGMSASEVEQVLGEPSWQDRCGAKFPYGWEQNCVAEFGYRAAFAPFPPTYLVVQLDNQSRVISVDTITSP